ncbi:bile acid:sodium symporter [Rhodococcus hoagii]|uniref:Sodium bile acid symporter family protein n=3 Tax=Rhodococcus hoagii TaxID=43767 RepID=E9T7P7_RHOHA|nr:bile acid:sodium symporter family protein [Prescottella equi]MBU4616143.1 bile acid:sodium symporter [Rhodococcus sp. GG48]MCD7053069.1 bile acid:sodium symporter [Rhodococcus sp. BH2-1]GBF16602.1 sodium Bile acid symporter family protein [Rhodococcus sp. Br-6]AVP70753.1 bile acid:sodium symporter [Prescottella equi]EGD21508.1 sodium bile acid symporter family protein [Prescottella equi ATCC 33707]
MKFLSRFYIDGFILAIVAVAILGSLFPVSGGGQTVLDWATKIAIGFLFLLYGARLSPAEALQGLKHWRLHSVVFAATFVLFPLIGLALRILVPTVITDEMYTGILYLCLVPSTVQSSIAFTSIARGNVAGAIVSASFSNLLGVFVTPLLVILLMNTTGEATVDFSSVLDIVLQLLLPFMVGQLIRPLVIDWLKKYAEPTKLVDRGSILLVVFSAFSESMNEHIWSTVTVLEVAAVVAVCCGILAVVLGATAFAGRKLGFSLPDRIVIIFCGSKKSLATGLPMASVLFAGQPVGLIVLPLMIFHQIQLIVCAALAQHYAKRTDPDPVTA